MMRWTLALGVLLLAGCLHLEDPAPSQQTQLVVHAVLNPFAFQQFVLVYRARTGVPNAVEGGSLSDDEPVAGAEVTITAPDGITTGSENLIDPSGQCCVSGTYIIDQSLVVPITASGTYTLRIRTPLAFQHSGIRSLEFT